MVWGGSCSTAQLKFSKIFPNHIGQSPLQLSSPNIRHLCRKSGALSSASRSFDEFEELVDVEPLRRSLQSLMMSHLVFIRAARRNAPTLMIRARRGYLFQGEIPCGSQALGLRSPIRQTSARYFVPKPSRRQRLRFADLS